MGLVLFFFFLVLFQTVGGFSLICTFSMLFVSVLKAGFELIVLWILLISYFFALIDRVSIRSVCCQGLDRYVKIQHWYCF